MLAVLVAAAMRRSLPLANADALLFGLISTEELTFYYWGQDRLANLVPAIAWPVQQIEWNYLLQTAIVASSFFVLIGCFVWFHATRSGRSTSWPAIITASGVTGALTLMLLSRDAVYDFALVQQHALSMLLFLVGLWCVTGGGAAARVIGAVAILAGVLVNPSTVLLAPAAAVMGRGSSVRVRTAIAIGVSGLALVIATIIPRVAYDGITYADDYTDFSLGRFGVGFRRSVAGIADSLHVWPTALVGVVCVAVLVARRRHLDVALRWAYAMCPVIALGWVALFSANRWLEMNEFRFRYHFPAYAAGLFVMAGGVTEMVAWVARRRATVGAASPARGSGGNRIAIGVAAVVTACSVVAGATVTVPAIEAGRQQADLAHRYDADLIVGDYWQVWPAMFADRAGGGELIAVSQRTEPLVGRVRAIAESSETVGVVCVDGDRDSCLDVLMFMVGGDWRIVSTVSERPLVLELATG